MLKVYGCFVGQHDLRLVLVAATVCVLATVAAMTLLDHARHSAGLMRTLWLAVAAVASGFGIWATHFIAILAYSPGVPSGEDLPLVVLSLLAAMLFTAVGYGIALGGGSAGDGVRRNVWSERLGGAVVGVGIAALHYTGMLAFNVAGQITFDPGLVTASIVSGIVFAALALPIGLSDSLGRRLAGAGLLALAVSAHHFIGMGALSIVPDPSLVIGSSSVPTKWLALPIALASLVVVGLAWTGLAVDLRERKRIMREADRMRSLADAAVEGLLICRGGGIVTANRSFSDLTGFDAATLTGASLATCFPEPAVYERLAGQPGCLIEAELRHRDGSAIAVEVMLRVIDYGGTQHHALAVRDMRDRRAAEERIRFLAHHDALTGLANRSSFDHKLDRAIEKAKAHDQRLAVLCLDLDRFKEVNDHFGHLAGDKLLQRLACTVTAALGDNQMMARLDGDEFAVLVTDVTTAAAVGRIAETIIETIGRENQNLVLGVAMSGSIGIAIYPNDGTDRRTMLSNADQALHRAKSEGRGTYRFFEAAISAEVRDRRLIEYELRDAVICEEMRLVYQPQTLVETGEVVGFEALIRWRHPIRGEISPGLFIPIAEECGAIEQIGTWVLRMACREAAGWKKPLRIAVNVSAIQIHAPDFARLVHQVLSQTGLAPSRLELEITETALIRDLNRALTTLRRLRALDVRIAMDDFGMGYSSLSNLRAFPFDKIKIDGSFVRGVDGNEQGAAIVRAVLGLGRGLKLPILAEGVETSGELAFLKAEGCQEAQGFLIGRPAAIDVFRAAIDGIPGSGAAGGTARSAGMRMQRLRGSRTAVTGRPEGQP